ncbi:solute carrier family 23 protein [Streptomyces boninensis]|uniref:solute carrier family 23 protein n=1 Tax=Streptomyces boninensis TaxID=2039455 RepID=UPI003B224A99
MSAGRRFAAFAPRRIAAADLSASVTVFLIALPLSLGIALATGAPLQAGLVAAAVGGIVGGLLGGSPLQVSGPAAGLTVVVADIIQVYGWRTTCAITAAAGLAQLALASLKVARNALAVSPSIVHGMLAGIGVTIAVAQLHIVLGGSPQSSAVDNVLALPEQLANLHPAALSVSGIVVLVLLLWPRLHGRAAVLKKAPAALVAIVLASLAAWVMQLPLAKVDIPSWRSHALPEVPHGPVLGLLTAVLTITLVASVESLLSAVAVDKLSATRPDGHRLPRANLDKELRGQGTSNLVSGLLGGLPVTGVAVRSGANVAAGAVSRNSAVLHGVWMLAAAALLGGALELIPLAALAALVMVIGVQLVKIAHIRSVLRHREGLVYVVTLAGVVLFGVLEGVGFGIAVAIGVALHRLARTRITQEEEPDGTYRVKVRGQLTFLAVPRLSRALAQVPQGSDAVVELDGSFMDHAAYETLKEWRAAHGRHGGSARLTSSLGRRIAEPDIAHHCRPWTPWHNHACVNGIEPTAVTPVATQQLLSGVSNFQRATAPLVRDELARLAREGQRPTQLFLTCSDSRLVTSMITSSGPGDLFTVRNVGNLVPIPGGEVTDDSVAAAIEYAVEVLRVESITVCGHSGCGAMQALLDSEPAALAGPAATPLQRWLRHGAPSLELVRRTGPKIAGRTHADDAELLSLANVAQQLNHLLAHECVARRVNEGSLSLHGMYFHVGEAQAYVLSGHGGDFTAVGPGAPAQV